MDRLGVVTPASGTGNSWLTDKGREESGLDLGNLEITGRVRRS